MKILKVAFTGLSFCMLLGFTESIFAQANIEFARNGNTIRISNLLKDSKSVYGATKCGTSLTFSGKITEIINIDSDTQSGFEFTLKHANGKPQKLKAGFTWSEEVKFNDVDNLLRRNRNISIKVRHCGDSGYLAEEIKRL